MLYIRLDGEIWLSRPWALDPGVTNELVSLKSKISKFFQSVLDDRRKTRDADKNLIYRTTKSGGNLCSFSPHFFASTKFRLSA